MPRVPKLNASQVLEAVQALHPDPQWAFVAELRVGTGYDSGRAKDAPNEAEQRLDAWAINCWPSQGGFQAVAYEVKISRADFLHELKHPYKRELGLRYSNLFYFAAPKGLIKKSELPRECGLVEVDEAGRAKLALEAPRREMEFPPPRFLAALGRRAGRALRTPGEVKQLESSLAQAVALAEAARGEAWSRAGQLLELERLIRALLEATGWIHAPGRGLAPPGQSRYSSEQGALRLELERLQIALPPLVAEKIAFPSPALLDARYRRQLREGTSLETLLGPLRERAYREDLLDPAALACELCRDLLLPPRRLLASGLKPGEREWLAAQLADDLLRASGYRFGRAEGVVQAFAALELGASERGQPPPTRAVAAFQAAVIPGPSEKALASRLPGLKGLLEQRAGPR